MSAADRVVIRTRSGEVRTVPRRAALGMIARGGAKAAPRAAKVPPLKAASAPVKPLTKPVEVRVPRVAAKSPTARVLPPVPVVEAVAPVVDPVELVTPDVERVTVDVTKLPMNVPIPVIVDTTPPKQNASRKAWAEYASNVRGVVVTSDMTRNQLRDLIAKMDSARMSRPAFTEYSVDGGRPATPEDVPVTESVVTHAHRDSAGA